MIEIPDTYSGTREKRNSGLITAFIISGLFLLLWFWHIVTPIPPFPEGGGGGGMMMALGLAEYGSGEVDLQKIGSVREIVTEEEQKKENLLSDENSDVGINTGKDEEKKEKEIPRNNKEKPVVIKQEKKEKSEAEILAEMFKKNQGKSGSGNSDIIGQQGSPDGIPGGKGEGGAGGGSGGGIGPGEGQGAGPGKNSGIGGGVRFDLRGRSILRPPSLPKDTKEEGIVVVEITVDEDGNVIEANPNGRGTTTNSSILKAKARQAALATKFNKAPEGITEQKGTITIVFSFD